MQTSNVKTTANLRVHTVMDALQTSEKKKTERENTTIMSHSQQTGTNLSNRLPVGVYQYYLIFDTETTTDEKQSLRFGVYEIHGRPRFQVDTNTYVPLCAFDKLMCRGLFYNPAILSQDEKLLLQNYASQHSMVYCSANEFVHILYAFAHNQELYTCVIGHNVPFDISRLAQEWQLPKGDFANGFSLKLCSCTWQRQGRKRSVGDSCKRHPNIKVKKISPKAAIFEFADKKPRGNFLDTATLARALLGPGSTSLESLGHMLGIDQKKLTEQAEHGVSLTETYIDYAVRDVTATWQIYQKLRAIYASYNFSQKIHYIFSEASLGKALYKELNIKPAMKRMDNIPDEVHGYAMAAYYGGRSEVHMRHEEVQVSYCDFKSEYPTVFSLMGLQDMLLAERFEAVDMTDKAQYLVDTFDLSDLQYPGYWQYLRVLCKVSGDNLILPIRAKFNKQSNNIALCNADLQGTWYTLSDVLAGILLGGAIPTIEQAIEVVPVGRIDTKSLEMFDGLVSINPDQDNIFTTLINERTRIKRQAKQATGQEKEKLERTQLALKLLANSTSYGINIELRTEDTDGELLLYGNDGLMQAASSESQQPGTYYCPLIGTHIPAGGRLLLAIAQRLGADRGLSYAFCDTDSMAFCKPYEMSDSDFYGYVKEIRKWFQPLYPYSDSGELFELEDVNFWQPLYFLGVSAKRYVLYNKGLGSIRIRKVSSHGLGAFRVSDSYKSPVWIAEPEIPLKELGLTQHTRWIYDIWYEWIKQYEEFDTCENVQAMWSRPNLASPAYQQTVLATAYLYKLFKNIPDIRPFNFVTTFFALSEKALLERIVDNPDSEEAYAKCVSSLYVPFTTNVDTLNTFYVIRTNELVTGVKPLTIEEAIDGYFSHPEWKSANGHFSGEMKMRSVEITGWIPQGKESSYEVLDLEDSGLPTSIAREAVNMEYMTREQWDCLREGASIYGVNRLARAMAMSPMQVSRMLASQKPPKPAILKQLKQALLNTN